MFLQNMYNLSILDFRFLAKCHLKYFFNLKDNSNQSLETRYMVNANENRN